MSPRGRPQGSRNKRRVAAERMESDLVEQTDMQTIAPLVEEKFNNFPPAKDVEKEKKILGALEDIDPDEDIDEEERDHDLAGDTYLGEPDKYNSAPYYLRHLPLGADRSKHIVAAAQAAIVLGTPPAQVAEQYGISLPRIKQWKDTLITTSAIGKRDRLSDMLFAYIEQEMKSLLAISMITSDEEWVMRQTASDLAHYVAVKSDRLLLLLQAFARTNISQREYEQQLKVITDNAES